MKLKLLLLFFSFFVVSVSAQEYVFGKVSSEFGNIISEAIVYNVNSDEKVYTDRGGNFTIKAGLNDQLRFVKLGYDRAETIVQSSNFSEPIHVNLKKSEVLIPEVELLFHPSGNIVKDTKALNPPKKVVALNEEANTWLKEPQTEVYQKNDVPSAFQNKLNYGGGDLFALVGMVVGAVKNKTNPITTPTFAETEAFYRKVKQEINLDYFRDRGLDDFAIDRFLAYAESVGQLSKLYRNNFDKNFIQFRLQGIFAEYSKIMDSVS